MLRPSSEFRNVSNLTDKDRDAVHSDTVLTLSRGSELYAETESAAVQRFQLGYPPRKASADATMGDALNWEWVVHCARTHKQDVIIVSADSDYGTKLDNNEYVVKTSAIKIARVLLLERQGC